MEDDEASQEERNLAKSTKGMKDANLLEDRFKAERQAAETIQTLLKYCLPVLQGKLCCEKQISQKRKWLLE